MSTQLELATPAELAAGAVPHEDQLRLRAHLASRGWQTRNQIVAALDWPVRYVSEVAESMGADVVRGQRGFHLTETIDRDNLPAALQAADAFLSQAKRMERYAIALRRRLHGAVG